MPYVQSYSKYLKDTFSSVVYKKRSFNLQVPYNRFSVFTLSFTKGCIYRSN